MFLVTWIAVMNVDNSFSTRKRGEMLFYKGYQKQLPSQLTRLLQLWPASGGAQAGLWR